MWAYESVFYQIYPLGFCGAPFANDGQLVSRIKKAEDWIPHIMAIIQGITVKWMCVLAQMKILQRYAESFTKQESALC